jgi:2-methylcitrate dehydratase PrpD
MARTDCYRDATLDRDYPKRWPAAAEIKLRDGRVLSTRVEFATGEPENPVSRAALVDKFVSLAGSRALAERILAANEEPDVRSLGRALRG